MKAFVVDTSALVRLYVPDGPVPTGLEEAVDLAWRGEAALFAPALALAEAAQVLRKKERAGYLSADESDAIRAEILGLPIDFSGHRDLLDIAVPIARDRDLTVYDALFLALADERRAELITADEALCGGRRRGSKKRS
jgi:predicted nucleic acid-binding protein